MFMKIQEFFKLRVDELINHFQGNKVCLFFCGFTNEQARYILSRPESIISIDPSFDQQGNLDLEYISSQKRVLLKNITFSNQSTIIGLYEHFLKLSEMLQSFEDVYDGNIYIIRNNLFNKYLPNALSPRILRRLDEHFHKESMESIRDLETYLTIVGDILTLSNGYHLVNYINRHDDYKIDTINFFEQTHHSPFQLWTKTDSTTLYNVDYYKVIYDVISGETNPQSFYATESQIKSTQFNQLLSLLELLNIKYDVSTQERQLINAPDSDDDQISILKEYWGEHALFRNLTVYKNPEFTKEILEISQGTIINQIIHQSLLSRNNATHYRDVFVTAPTGAGKSLLFQIPGLYFAKNNVGVTIVVTPLISLMKDQIDQLINDKNIDCATFINSSISFDERESRIHEIKNGRISIVYLAPELLLSIPLDQLIGSRRLALLVIDEAHTVTSWGKDFRTDYWFLGDFIKTNRNSGKHFPVFCLTATAVLGGSNDVVNETIESLSLINPILYLGNVKRKNIGFDFRSHGNEVIEGGLEARKVELTLNSISTFIKTGRKALVYCPFKSQVNDIHQQMPLNMKPHVRIYHGDLNKVAREDAQNSFQSGKCTVMVCTKAFGMGVDVKDITNVYHYAATGNLADYVQEIGRVARDPNISGLATVDFFHGDMRYVRTLNSLSEMRQYQLKEMIRKIYDIYSEKNHRNLLVSPESFLYLFDEENLDNKVKNGLLMIAKDLEATYGFPVMVVKPRFVYTRNYVSVPKDIELEFLRKFGKFSKLQDDHTRITIDSKNSKYASDTIVMNNGKIYLVDMSKIWESHFSEQTFSMFKRKFFNGEILINADGLRLSPRLLIKIQYKFDFDVIYERIESIFDNLTKIFAELKKEQKHFTVEDFRSRLSIITDEAHTRFDISQVLLDLFVINVAQNIGFNQNSDKTKFLSARKSSTGSSLSYAVQLSSYATIKNQFITLLRQSAPGENNVYQAYIAYEIGKQPKLMKLLSILELFDLASYDVSGGQNTEIFVRLNDPVKLRRLSAQNYSNSILKEINRRHKYEQLLMASFFQTALSDEIRWNLIEDYFLGRDDVVETVLHINS